MTDVEKIYKVLEEIGVTVDEDGKDDGAFSIENLIAYGLSIDFDEDGNFFTAGYNNSY